MSMPGLLRCFLGIAWREILRFLQQRSRFVAALVRPLIWLFVFAAGFRSVLGVSIVPPYQTYILYDEYVIPGLVAMVLYSVAPREAWSAFVNLFTIPCVLSMFIGEYAVRRIRFPSLEHSSILDGARAFQRAFSSREPPP